MKNLLVILFFVPYFVNSQNIFVNYSSPYCVPFVDARDGKSYTTVLIGSQCWMAENLNYGTRINVGSAQDNNSVPEKYCLDNDNNRCNTYGGLYQWGEAVQYTNGASNTASPSPAFSGNVQGICPTGWHLPTDAEWCIMVNTVGPGTDPSCNIAGSWRGQSTDTGYKLKATTGWSTNNGTNTSGFSALPGGYRSTGGVSVFSSGFRGRWWTATQSSSTLAWRIPLDADEDGVGRDDEAKNNGFSIRCVKD